MSKENESPPEIGEAVAEDWDRERLRGLLLEGAASPPAVTADADYFSRLRRKVCGGAPR